MAGDDYDFSLSFSLSPLPSAPQKGEFKKDH